MLVKNRDVSMANCSLDWRRVSIQGTTHVTSTRHGTKSAEPWLPLLGNSDLAPVAAVCFIRKWLQGAGHAVNPAFVGHILVEAGFELC